MAFQTSALSAAGSNKGIFAGMDKAIPALQDPSSTASEGRLTADGLRDVPLGSGFGEIFRNMQARNQAITDFGGSHLRSSLARTKEQRGQFGELRNRQANNVGNQANRLRHQVGKVASLRAAREGGQPTSFAGSIQDATRRAGARQGIVNRGEKAISNQSLKDRLSFVQAGMRRRGVAQQSLSQGANIREGVNIGVTDANNAISASNSDLMGSVVGSVAGFAADPKVRDGFMNLFKRDPKPLASSTQGVLPNAGIRTT